jgi:hypothetical protein
MATVNHLIGAFYPDYSGEAANVGITLYDKAGAQIGARVTGLSEVPAASGRYQKVHAIDTDDLPISYVSDIASSDAPLQDGSIDWSEIDPAIYTSSSGTGPHAQTYTVLDGDDDPVVGALVRLVSATESIEATTDNDGEAVLYASADNYTETISKAGYTTTSQALSVSAAAARERSIEQYVPTPSPDPETVPVTFRAGDNGAQVGTTFTLEMVEPRTVVLEKTPEVDKKKSVTVTDGGPNVGYFHSSAKLVAAGYDGRYKVRAPDVKGLPVIIEIPAEGGEIGDMIREALGLEVS